MTSIKLSLCSNQIVNLEIRLIRVQLMFNDIN